MPSLFKQKRKRAGGSSPHLEEREESGPKEAKSPSLLAEKASPSEKSL